MSASVLKCPYYYILFYVYLYVSVDRNVTLIYYSMYIYRCTLRWSEIYVFSKIDIHWLRLIRGSINKYKSEVLFKTDTCKLLRYQLEV